MCFVVQNYASGLRIYLVKRRLLDHFPFLCKVPELCLAGVATSMPHRSIDVPVHLWALGIPALVMRPPPLRAASDQLRLGCFRCWITGHFQKKSRCLAAAVNYRILRSSLLCSKSREIYASWGGLTIPPPLSLSNKSAIYTAG